MATLADTGAYDLKRDPGSNWIISPIARCIQFLASETVRAGVVIKALQATRLVRPLLTLTQRFAPTAARPGMPPMTQYLAELESVAKWSHEIEEGDFSAINQNSLVAIWSAVETAIEDTVVLVVMNEPEAVSACIARARNIHANERGLLDEKEGRRLYRILERQASRSQGVLEAFDWILGQLRITRQPSTQLYPQIAEINAIRNSLVHRAGRVDAMAVQQAPTLASQLGEQIRVTQDDYRHYFDSLSVVAQEVLNGVLRSPYIRDREELQRRVISELAGDD